MKLNVSIESVIKKIEPQYTTISPVEYELIIRCQGSETACEKIRTLLFKNLDKNCKAN